MSWPKDPYITDSGYKTPLPSQPCERQVWRVVARLYTYNSLATLMKVNEAYGLTPPTSPSTSDSHGTLAPETTTNLANANAMRSGGGGAGAAGGSPTRAEMKERRSAFIAAAAASSGGSAVGPHGSSCSVASSTTASPLSTLLQRRSFTDSPGIVAATAAAAMATAAATSASTAPPVTTVPATSSSSQPVSPFGVTSASGSWNAGSASHLLQSSNNRSGGNSMSGGTTNFIRATSLRALEPLHTLLEELAAQRQILGAGVVDVAVQHPLPCLRLELVRLLLSYPRWDWSMCAPVAVAAAKGDMEVLQLLMEVQELDPNTGFPLTVAVRQKQEEAVLPFLLSHHRIRPNYGGAFYVAVVLGNTRAMYLLGDAAGVNVNRFANNEGTSALLYALRQYLICRRWELQQAQLDPPSATPLLHAAKPPPQQVSSPTRLAPAALQDEDEEEITATPLLVVHASPSTQRRNSNKTNQNNNGGKSHSGPHLRSYDADEELADANENNRGEDEREKEEEGEGEVANDALRKRSPMPALSLGAQRDHPLRHETNGGVGEDEQRGDTVAADGPHEGRRRSSAATTTAAAAAPAAVGRSFEDDVATEMAAAAGLSLPADDSHIAAFRKDTKERPLQTARHWLEVLLYLLDHPAIEVNAGFYMTPLQICVLAGSAEVVSWLLQHPHLRPSRLPKATTALCNSYYLLQHHALSQPAMQCVVATPLEMAAQLRHLDIFRHLACDQRIQVPVSLTMELERSASDGAAIPFLTVLAQHREDWEGWGWRWRRRCTFIATASITTMALCFWVMVFVWRDTLRGCLLVLTATYLVAAGLSVVLYLWETHRVRYAAETAVTHGAATVLALVRHLCPAWTSLQQHVAVVALLACPGLVPLLDLLCAWCLFTVHRSRRRIEAGEENGDGRNASSHSVTPTGAATAGATHHGPSQHPHQHHQHHAHRGSHGRGRAPLPGGYHSSRHPLAQERSLDAERLSSTVSWGWSVGVSNASNLSSNSSFSENSPNASGSATGNESFSRPRPSTAVTRRQTAAAAAAAVNRVARPSGTNNVGEASFTSLPPTTAGNGGSRQVSFAADSFVGGHASTTSMPSPSLCTSRSRGPWVVPGRPSRYALTTKYRAPDLLLRALAYTTFDAVLILPRLLTCVVGIFMFLYLVFPATAPHTSSASALLAPYAPASTPAAVAEAVRGRSAFTLYYHPDRGASAVSGAQPAAYSIDRVAAMATTTATAAASSSADLANYTIGIGIVGFFGLVASVMGGGTLLAMMGSLRNVTVQAFFASSSDKADARVGPTRQGGAAATENTDWHAVRHRAREVQPTYTL